MSAAGMKKGEMRRTLPSCIRTALSSIVCSPPMPEPIITPVAQRSGSSSGRQPEEATASSAATSASWMKRSIFRWSLGGIHSARSSPPSAFVPGGAWPAILAGSSLTSKDWMAEMPESAVDQALPDQLDADAERADDAHSGDYDATHGGAVP